MLITTGQRQSPDIRPATCRQDSHHPQSQPRKCASAGCKARLNHSAGAFVTYSQSAVQPPMKVAQCSNTVSSALMTACDHQHAAPGSLPADQAPLSICYAGSHRSNPRKGMTSANTQRPDRYQKPRRTCASGHGTRAPPWKGNRKDPLCCTLGWGGKPSTWCQPMHTPYGGTLYTAAA